MPFKETCVLEERIALFREYETGAFTVGELCARYGVSRETFYVWKRRRQSGQERWFEERSRAPVHRPQATCAEVRVAVIAMRQRFPGYGPKKIRAKLCEEQPGMDWPAISTIGDILKREGLIVEHKRRRRPVARGEAAASCGRPNEEWAIDFKGWFRTADGERCDPLTVTDTASRYLIEARIVEPTARGVQGALEQIFEAVGLPDAIRSDNGSPFGSSGAGGLSRLSVRWLKLGIEPRYIPPASPQHNGRHERMHRTLKAETAMSPAASAEEQQARFERFRRSYNEERPHEALGQTPPIRHWQPSGRPMPPRIEDPWYDADHQVRRVRPTGDIKWRGEYVFIGEALAGELVGLAELEAGGHIVRFCGRDLGVIDRSGCFTRFAPPRARLRQGAERNVNGVRDVAG